MRFDQSEQEPPCSTAPPESGARATAREESTPESISFREIFERASVGIAVASLNGRFEHVNARFCEIVGYTAEELHGRTFLDLTHAEDHAETKENSRRLAGGEIDSYSYEKRFIRKNGEIICGLASVTLLRNSAGKPAHFVGVIEDITSRKRAEAEVKEGAERFHLALSAGHLGDWSWNAKTDRITAGKEAREVFGIGTLVDLTWKEFQKRIYEEDREHARAAFEEALSSGADYDIEFRILRGGQHVWIAARGRGIYESDGSASGMIGVVQDIGARKEAEQTRQRLAAMVESSDDAIISMNLEAIITTWNEGAARMFGYAAEEVIGKSVTILVPPGCEDEEPMILDRIVNGERVDHYETIRKRKDGTLLNVSLMVSPIYDLAGNIAGVSKISRDITDKKRAEEALRDESRVLELLNKAGRAISSHLELRNLVQTVTDSATELTGAKFGAFFYNVLDDQGESYMLYTLSGAPREAFDKFGHPRATPLFGPTFRGEPPVRCYDVTKDPRYGKWGPHYGMPEGHLPVRSYLAVPVISRNGSVIGGLFFAHPDVGVFTERSEKLVVGVAAQAAIAIDNARLYEAAQKEIAERKRAEDALRDAQAELRRHAETLEEEVAERTAQLRETIQELEAFSYSVSHDMRSPLRAMQGYADALLEDYHGKLDETGQEYLTRIRRAALRMDLLVQDVLAYSRVAKAEIHLRPLDLEHVIRDVILHYPGLQPERATVTVHPPIPPVLAHEAYATQIISNLLSNAVKFVNKGVRPAVDIQARMDRGMVRLSFIDNGIGIAPEHQKQIFQIFGRVYSEKKFEGTGIGLAIAKKAAERMGGSIGVISEAGRGSEFFVLLRPAT